MAYNPHPTHASYYSNSHLTTEASNSNTSATDIFSIQNSVDELQHILPNPPTKIKNNDRSPVAPDFRNFPLHHTSEHHLLLSGTEFTDYTGFS